VKLSLFMIDLPSLKYFYFQKATEQNNRRLTNETNVVNKEQLEQIISGCLGNDRRSQEKLFKLYYGKMLSVCMRYSTDRDSAEEVVQEGFIKIFDKLEAFDYKGSFEGWMRRIMANTAIDSIRKSKKDPILTDNDEDFKLGASNPMIESEEIELSGIKAEIAMEAINELSPSYKAVFNLYVFEDYKHKEIAEILGISEGTSKSNFAKAKMNLQKILKEKFMNID
jgi:RNA polymerase sigma factor (sigma-70 family)